MSRCRASTVLITIAFVLSFGGPAAAGAPGDEDEPIGEPFEPAPFELPAELPDSGPFPAPAGIYAVTDAYTGDYVTHDGAVTTYGTATVHGLTDTYARVIDTVATGAGSVFDGAAFNGRSALTDGRAVAGTYYESFFLTDEGYRSLGIVFFQDDAETAGSPGIPGPLVAPAPAPTLPPPAAPVAAAPGLPPVAPAAPPRAAGAAPAGAVAPGIERPGSGPVLTPPAARVAEPLAGGSVEVLRGRRVEIWLRGLPAGSVWSFVGGEAVVLGPRTGGAAEPFVARWDRLALPGAAWPLVFEITAAGAPPRALALEVTVRSPGLVE